MPLIHTDKDPIRQYHTCESLHTVIASSTITFLMYSTKDIHREWMGIETYNSINLSCFSDTNAMGGLHHVELCPYNGSTEWYAGKWYAGNKFTDCRHLETFPPQNNPFYYNKILAIIEDCTQMSIEEFTHGSFHYVEYRS